MSWLVEPGEPHRVNEFPRAIQLADLATVALILLAADLFWAPVRIAVISITLRDFMRPLVAAAIITLVRHYFLPAPSLFSRVRDGWRRAHAAWPALTTAVPLAIIIRLVVLGIGYLAVVTVGFRAAPPPNTALNPWWDLPNRWDAGWYIGIAHEGYEWSGDVADQQNLNFFPAYPMLVRGITFLIHTHGIPRAVVIGWTATLVSIAAFAAAAVYIYRIAADRFGSDVGTGAVLLIATYPFAVFYSAVYRRRCSSCARPARGTTSKRSNAYRLCAGESSPACADRTVRCSPRRCSSGQSCSGERNGGLIWPPSRRSSEH